MDIRLLGWEGYDDPLLLAPFSRTNGIAVHLDTHISDFDAAQRVLQRTASWDLVNINSPFIRDLLYPAGKIAKLGSERLRSFVERPLPRAFSELLQWGCAPDGDLIGICQRFGPFNLVVNTDAVSLTEAEDQGFDLVAARRFAGRYGILDYEDFNVMHVAIASDLDPFVPLSEHQFSAFSATAAAWFSGARIITSDHHALNKALIDRDIDFHLGGGAYTASSARLNGHSQVRSVTPRRGPMNGRGGISFVEVNALLATTQSKAQSEAFLDYLVRPDTAVRACLAGGSANPVLQMTEKAVFSQLSSGVLDAMQYDVLEEDLSRCAQYRIVPDYERLRALVRAARKARLLDPRK